MRYTFRTLLIVFVATLTNSASAIAQGWSYPAFQPPRISPRELNFAVAHAGRAGTSLVFQWREEYGARQQLSLDLGIADPSRRRADLVVIIGGQYAAQLTRATGDDLPLDFLITAGAYLAAGDLTLFRFPVGLSVGQRIDLEGNISLTPYLHPRLSLDVCNNCGGASDIAASFDLGMNVDLSSTTSVRIAALFTGTESFDSDGFGISVAWTPPGLARKVDGRGYIDGRR